MTAYAQTNIQLYNQLGECGYTPADLARVHRGYALAIQLFTASFRGSGRPFLSHLVGTASVLAWIRAPIAVVTAGLLHSAYAHGEFGNSWRGMSDAKRARVRAAVGDEAEDLITRYTELRWSTETVGTLADTAASMDEADRRVMLIRLANELDDHQDRGLLYVAGVARRRTFIRTSLHRCVEMAERLGHPALAIELARVLKETLTADVPPGLRGPTDDSFLLAPASHSWRAAVVARWILARLARRIARGRSPAV